MYHGFGRRPAAADPFNLFVSADDLERQLRFLTRTMYPLDLPEYLERRRRGALSPRSFLLTVDDGYVSTLEVAAPLLARYGVPAVLFVCPGLLGGTSAWMPEMPGERLLTGEQVAELPRYGIEVGVHGMDHRLLPGMSRDDLRHQVSDARAALADLLGRAPRAFAYPEGRFDEAAQRAVIEGGYRAAFSVGEGRGRYAITRQAINTRDSMVTFAAKLLPGWERIERLGAGRPWMRRLGARVLRQRPLG